MTRTPSVRRAGAGAIGSALKSAAVLALLLTPGFLLGLLAQQALLLLYRHCP